jgi:glycosyltransferase involved in cell wall biosynthesis
VRILTIANHLDPAGGLERTQLVNCSGLAKRGHRIDLMYVHAGEFVPTWQAITSTMEAMDTTLPRRRRPFSSVFAVASGIHAARRLKPEVVYVYRYWDLPFAVAAAAMSRARVVYHLCLPPPKSVSGWFRRVLARVDWTVSVSEDTLKLWRATGLRTDRATVALTSVDLDTYRPGSAKDRDDVRRSMGLESGDFVVLFAGRLSPEKGLEMLINAFGILAGQMKGCRLVIVGSPSAGADPVEAQRYVERLREMAEGLPVSWLPRRRDVVPLLQAADVAAVPSLWPEPLSRSILEPLACGIPVVASRVGGSPEVLTDWLSDFLFDPDDAEALALGLASLHDWRSRDRTLGDRCRQFAASRLSPEDEIEAIEAAMLTATRSTRP